MAQQQNQNDLPITLRSGRQLNSLETQALTQIVPEFGNIQREAPDSPSSTSSLEQDLVLRETSNSNSNSNLSADQERAYEHLQNLFQSETQYVQAPVMTTTTTPEVFLVDPYEGDINPGTAEGSKLFNHATKADEKAPLLTINPDTKTDVISKLESYSRQFAWHKILSIETDSGTFELFKQIDQIELTDMQKNARKYFGDGTTPFATDLLATFTVADITPASNDDHKKLHYNRVRSKMIAKKLEVQLDAASFKKLTNESKKFTWGNYYDGPTMLWIILKTLCPSTIVGVTGQKLILQNIRLNEHGYNVEEMLSKMQDNYNQIIERGQTHDDYLLHLFLALGSGKNDQFNIMLAGLQTAFEKNPKSITPDDLISQAITKYNNLKELKQWNTVDPNEAKLISLVTKCDNLEAALQQFQANATSDSRPARVGRGMTSSGEIEAWRKVKKEDSVTRDGTTWYWCPDHKREGDFDGLYVTHKPGKGHQEWLERKNKSKKNKGSSKLVLTDKLKSALATKMKMNDSELNDYLDEQSK